MGIISPVGSTLEGAWNNVVQGVSGIGPITRFDASAFKARIAGEVKGFDVAAYLSPKEARRMDVFIHYGMAAGLQAIEDAGLTDDASLDPGRGSLAACHPQPDRPMGGGLLQ